MVDRILDGFACEALGALLGYRFDADTDVVWKADLGGAHVIDQKINNFLCFFCTGFVFDTSVDVLGVLPEDNHIAGAGVLDRGRYALKPAYRAQAGIQVQFLAKRDVQGAETATYRCCQWPLDRH